MHWWQEHGRHRAKSHWYSPARLPARVEEGFITYIYMRWSFHSNQHAIRQYLGVCVFELFGFIRILSNMCPERIFFTLPRKALPFNNNVKLSLPSRRPWIAHSQIPSEAMACTPWRHCRHWWPRLNGTPRRQFSKNIFHSSKPKPDQLSTTLNGLLTMESSSISIKATCLSAVALYIVIATQSQNTIKHQLHWTDS